MHERSECVSAVGGYFPGFVSALVYWVIGFILISAVVRSNKAAIGVIFLLTILLIPTLTFLSTADGMAAVQTQMAARF